MTEVINLRQKRKEKDRAEKDKQAAANRAKHGRTKEQRLKQEAEKARNTRHVDGHKLGKDEEAD